jgi:glycogen synthase
VGEPRPHATRLEAQAHALGVASAVNFVGLVRPEAVPELIGNCTLVVMPTRLEAFGLVALQAAQMGRPVVATRVGGLVDLVVDGETGMLVDPDASQALAEAIALLLQRPDLRKQMGQAAQRRSGELFSWERFVDAYDALYRRIARTAHTAV